MVLSSMIFSNQIDMNLVQYQHSYKTAPVFDIHFENFEDQDNIIRQSSQAMLFNLAKLIYTDIFVCTKPNYGKLSCPNPNYKDCTTPKYIYSGEINPLANEFFKRGLWTTGFISALGFFFASNEILLKIDKSGLSSIIFDMISVSTETYFILSWKDCKYTPNNINLELFYCQYEF
jgi:hypothetical protein